MPHLRSTALAFLTVALLAGCGGGGGGETAVAPPPPPPPPPAAGRPASVERTVSPVAADAAVDTATEPHVAINPSPALAPSGRLFVMLPGTEGLPSMYRQVLRTGATRGYHTLGLNYPNPTAVGLLCINSADSACYWNVRREIVTGANLSPLVSVNGPNAIATRLARALAYLAQTQPDEGWGQFLQGGAVDWSKVTVAGHSQGGGHAAVIAKLFAVQRAVYFASPADWSNATSAPAAWIAGEPGQTPASRQYGFTHLDDPLVPYDQLSVIWQALGLAAAGGTASVDGAAAPYGNARLLTTRATPAPGLAASPLHGAPVLDAVTPLAGDGTPLFAPVWATLAFPAN